MNVKTLTSTSVALMFYMALGDLKAENPPPAKKPQAAAAAIKPPTPAVRARLEKRLTPKLISEIGYGKGFVKIGKPLAAANIADIKVNLPAAQGCYRLALAVADKRVKVADFIQKGRGSYTMAQPHPGLFVSTRVCTDGKQGTHFTFKAVSRGSLNITKVLTGAAAVQIYTRAKTKGDAEVDAKVRAGNRAIRRKIARACRRCRRPGWQNGSLSLERRFKVKCLLKRSVAPIQCIREVK